MGRLALQRGGEAVDDPYGWWDSLEDDAVAFWEAYWQVEPWGGDWERSAMVCAMVDQLFAATINPNLKKHDRHTPRQLSEFLPVGSYSPKQKTKASRDLAKKLDDFAGVNKK